MKRLLVLVATAATLAAPLRAPAAEAAPPADPTQPATTARVGGSPADKAFREAMNKSGADDEHVHGGLDVLCQGLASPAFFAFFFSSSAAACAAFASARAAVWASVASSRAVL